MPEISSSAIVVFTSVSFLLVTEISSITRNMEMERLAKTNRAPFEFGFITIPNFSRFTLLHAINIMILISVGLALFLLNKNLITALLIGPTLAISFLLPLLEIDEFDELLKDGTLPQSLSTHIQTVLTIVVLLTFLIAVAIFAGGNIAYLSSAATVLVLFVAPWPAAILFTKNLDSDLKWI